MTPISALQSTLAAEHAAIHVLAALAGASRGVPEGPETENGDDPVGTRIGMRHRMHRGRREHLLVMLRAAGEEPVPAAPAYSLPARGTADELHRGVLEVERRCFETYAALVAASTDTVRGWAVEALQESAVASLDWSGTPEHFPGAEDLRP